jgi:hypothetical protein
MLEDDAPSPPAGPNASPLLAGLFGLRRAHRPAYRHERSFRRMQALLFGQLFCCARNRALYALPETEEGKRGRRPKYGEKARKPQEWLAERSGWRQV